MPPRTVWQVHRRVAQHSPSRNPTTPHTPPHHRDTFIPPQHASKQAKPSRTRNTRRTIQLHRAVDTYPPFFAASSHSPAAPWPNCALTQQYEHVQPMHKQTLKKMLLLIPGYLPCHAIVFVKTNEHEEPASRIQIFLRFRILLPFPFATGSWPN